MKVGNIYIQLTGPDPGPQFGLKLYRSGQAVWEYPLVTLLMGLQGMVGLWVNMATAQGVDADRVGVRLGGNQYPFIVRLDSSDGNPGFNQTLSPSASVQEFTYDLPPSAPSPPPPPGGGTAQVMIGGLSFDKTQVSPGEIVRISANVQVNASFRGQMNTWLVLPNGAPWSGISTGQRDFLAGSYSVPLDLSLRSDTLPGTYPVTWRVNDAINDALAEYTTTPILTVPAAPTPPPPPPPPTGVVINSLTVSPDKVKPGEKITAAAQLIVSGGFKGMMSFSVAGFTESTGIKDWLEGNYPVTVELTMPQGIPAGIYPGIWLVVDTVAGKQLASREVPVEALPASSTVPPADIPSPASDWLSPVIGVASVGMVFAGVKGISRLIRRPKGW